MAIRFLWAKKFGLKYEHEVMGQWPDKKFDLQEEPLELRVKGDEITETCGKLYS